MARFDNSKALAQRLIEKNGQSVELVRIKLGSDVPEKPWRTEANVQVSETVTAVFLNYDIKQIDGDLVRVGDQIAYIAALSTPAPPTVGDYIKRTMTDGTEQIWYVVLVKPLAPNGDYIMYELGVRQ